MTSDAIALGRRGQSGELQAIGVVSAAHFVAHFHMLVLPPLFPFLTQHFGIGFVELGFALTIGVGEPIWWLVAGILGAAFCGGYAALFGTPWMRGSSRRVA